MIIMFSWQGILFRRLAHLIDSAWCPREGSLTRYVVKFFTLELIQPVILTVLTKRFLWSSWFVGISVGHFPDDFLMRKFQTTSGTITTRGFLGSMRTWAEQRLGGKSVSRVPPWFLFLLLLEFLTCLPSMINYNLKFKKK